MNISFCWGGGRKAKRSLLLSRGMKDSLLPWREGGEMDVGKEGRVELFRFGSSELWDK